MLHLQLSTLLGDRQCVLPSGVLEKKAIAGVSSHRPTQLIGVSEWKVHFIGV